MWPLSRYWQDPLAPGAPGSIIQSAAGLRARILGRNTRAIVFLHGLGASLRYWGRAYDALAARAQLIFVDLLGFGGSAKPTGTYDIACHVAALQATIEELGTTEAILVGHSTGGLIAMALGTERPRLVDRVIGFGVPIFPSAEAARQHIHRLGLMARLMADDVPLAKRMCRLMCDHRELARAVAPWLAPRLPAAVAADGVSHIWDSYSGTFRIVVHENRAREWGESLAGRLSLVYGSEDRSCPPAAAQATLGETISPEVIPGCDHHLPLRRAEVALRLIQRVVK